MPYFEYDGWVYSVHLDGPGDEDIDEIEYCYRDRPTDNQENAGKAEKS